MSTLGDIMLHVEGIRCVLNLNHYTYDIPNWRCSSSKLYTDSRERRSEWRKCKR